MSNNQLFDVDSGNGEIHLIYQSEQSIIGANDLGLAILGMSKCLKKSGELLLLNFDEVAISPIERGSVKSVFRYVRKHPLESLVAVEAVYSIIFMSISLYQMFGVKATKHPTSEIMELIKDPKVLELCQSREFREGAYDVVRPLNETHKSLEIKYNDETITITCDEKYKFFDEDQEDILPELVDGQETTITGEITRINKTQNDLGFKYKGRILNVIPNDKETSAISFHNYFEYQTVKLRGIVDRRSKYETPRLKVISIDPIEQMSILTKI